MDRNEILTKINEITKDMFDNDEIKLTEQTTVANIKEWDSLAHLSIMSDIKSEFGIASLLKYRGQRMCVNLSTR